MVARKFQVRHNDADFVVDYDTDDGFEIVGVDENRVLYDDLDLVSISERLRLVSVNDEVKQSQPESAGNDAALGMSDGELARMLQAEEEALMLQQYVAPENTGDFERQIRPYVDKVRMYEDLVRQEAARKTVPVEELEEKAMTSLAKEGNFKP